jgi:hypothetical protein
VHFTDLVDLAGEFQNTLGRGGFTGIYMGKNADIPIWPCPITAKSAGASLLQKKTRKFM